MFTEDSLNITAQIMDHGQLIAQTSKTIHLIKTAEVSSLINVTDLPSGNIQIDTIGKGKLKIQDIAVSEKALVLTDHYIVVPPFINSQYTVYLMDRDQIISSRNIHTKIYDYEVDFEIRKLSENSFPVFLELKIENLNIPTSQIVRSQFKVNDKYINSSGEASYVYINNKGRNTITLEVEAKTGITVSKSKYYVVDSSTIPSCEIEHDPYQNEIWAVCTDSDSFVQQYSFSYKGITVSTRNHWNLPPNYKEGIIEFNAVDNTGMETPIIFKIVNNQVIYVQ